MKKRFTLKQFVEKQEPFVQYDNQNIPENFKDLPRPIQAIYRDHHGKMAKLVKTAKGLIYGYYNIIVEKGRYGYWRRAVPLYEMTISGNRIYTKGRITYEDLNYLGVKDIFPMGDDFESEGLVRKKDIYIGLINANKTLLRAILTGNVYNEETFVKKVFSLWGGFKLQNWRDGKEFLEQYKFFHWLPYLKNHTDDPNKSLRILNNCPPCSDKNLLFDCLRLAFDLNEKINLQWSTLRVKEEHKKQIEKSNALISECDAMDASPIYEENLSDDAVEMLNNDKRIYIESKMMSNCIFTNYLSRIKQHNYLAFHIESPYRCTFGVTRYDDKLVLDQAYGEHNHIVPQETEFIVRDFIMNNKNKMISLLGGKLAEHYYFDFSFFERNRLPF